MNLHQLLERSDRPFLSHPQVGRYFPAASIEDARRRLARSIERGEGSGVVIGAAGTGKSLLLQVLATQYHERFDVVLLACAQMHTRRGLLQAIHFELGLDHEQRDEGELRLSLLDHLLSGDPSSQGLLLLVDEAQSLPTQLLEEIRVVGNLARNGAPRVRLVLAGLPPLEERLASPELDSFSQRLAARCYLTPLARTETAQYAQAQVAVCGTDPQQFFAPDAWDALFNATDGVPRLVNQLCDRAMLLADEQKLPYINGAAIRTAWADLQQLPAPSETSTDVSFGAADRSESIEFGSLGVDDAKAAEFTAVNAAPSYRFLPDPAVNFDAPAVVRRDMSASIGERQEVLASSAQRRPRTFDDCVPEAVDPFADEFEEEEVVLDRFSLLSEMFHAGTPRVANRRDPGFARLVGRALESKFDASDDPNSEIIDAQGEDVPQSHDGGNPTRRGFGPGQPTIRLAIVDESVQPEQAPHTRPRVVEAITSSLENDSPGTEIELARSPARLSPSVASNQRLTIASMAVSRQTDDPILIIEDEPARVSHSQAGARREEYRDLFSRLRHGT
jgi:type II secretory pathway predicted ATPase ExeA